MTWSPLACGIVSGKYDSGIPPYSRASLKVKQRRGLGEGTGRDRHFGGMEPLGLDTFPGPLSAERFQAWELGSPSWPDPMSRKADHLWDICQLPSLPHSPALAPSSTLTTRARAACSLSDASSPIDTPTLFWPITEPLGGGLRNFFSIPQRCPRDK